MAIVNPNDSSEILYGSSGDVRDELNAWASQSNPGHYIDEVEVPGRLIIRALARATHIINGYLEVVYADQIPVGSVSDAPKLMDEIGTDLATYYSIRGNRARLARVSDNERERYYDVHMSEGDSKGIGMGTLPKIRERKVQLPEFTSVYGDEVNTVRSPGQAPIFDIDSELNFEADPRTIDDIEQERDG